METIEKRASSTCTIKDIAQHSGCSPTTVSFVLNDHPLAKNIPDVTKQRIYDAVHELDYVPNAYAKMLREGIPPFVGVVSFDMMDAYCATVLHGIQKYLDNQNIFYRLEDVKNDFELLKNFLKTAKGQNIQGIVGVINSLAFTINPEDLAELLPNDFAFVSIGQAFPDLNVASIEMDNYESARLSIQHLYELGHRNIAYIVGPLQIHSLQDRWAAVQEICNDYAIPLQEELLEEIHSLPVVSTSGVEAVRRLLERKVDFTAIVTFDDMVAYGVIQELSRMGFSVPGDVSVIGSDDIWPSAAYNPPLTTIQQPMIEMGEASAKLVVEMLNHNNLGESFKKPNSIIMKPKLVVRESTAPPKKL